MTSIDNTTKVESNTNNKPTSLGLFNEPIVKLQFETNEEFQDWMANIANKQGIWYLKNNYNKVNPEREELLAEGRFLKNSQTYCCDRYGTPRKPRQKESFDENNEPIVKKRRKRGPSKKVSCRAHFCKKLFTNGQVEVLYHWQHVNHNPFEDINIRAKKTIVKQDQLSALNEQVLNQFKEFEQNVYIKLEEFKSNPEKLKELSDIFKRCLQDIPSTTQTNHNT